MQDFNLGEAILGFFGAYWNLALWVVTVAVGGFAFWKIVFDREDRNVTSAAPESHGLGRLWRLTMQAFGNWQLAVLGTTAILLSLVSGYTTWDGLRNFTQQPLISFMAAFGIQGVMLITSWLIGETFARGATGETERDVMQSGRERAIETARSSFPLLVGAVILALIVGTIYLLFPADDVREFSMLYGKGVTWTAIGLASFLFMAFVLILFSKTEILGAYAHGARIILANLHLWAMCLACMAISVFFSFDSHFSSIFPADERTRAAEIRAVNQVASTVADIGGLIQKRRIEESERLFALPSWQAYEKQLDAVSALAAEAPSLIREQISRELEEQKSRIATLEEKRATAQGGQAGLATRKATLTEDLSRLQGQRPNEAAEAQADKAKVTEVERLYAEQRVKTAAEEKGVEGTGKIGRGQFYRASKVEEDKLAEQLKIVRERLRNSEGRLTATDRRLTTIKAELAQIDGDLAKLKGEAETAGQMISVAQTGNRADAAQKFDPTAGVGALERARQTFRQKPEQALLADIQNACAALLGASAKVPSLHDKAARIDCDPREASEAAGRVFALNAGIVAFSGNCIGGDKLPQTGGTSALLSFGRKCLQDSGLPSKDSAAMGARLSSVDLNRDDKAHRFVVTWNAFLDGNRLAYLALSIAIAIDGLVFMAGLFGANALASPLSGTPEAKRRSVHDLEKVIYSALRPVPVNSADLAVNLMEPIRLPQFPGFTVFVDLNPLVNDQQRFAVRKVLTAGSGLGLVNHVGEYPSIYLIRRELHEYLLKVSGDEHDRGRRPEPAFATPQLDPSASMARPFLAHFARSATHARGLPGHGWNGSGAAHGMPGDNATDVTPHHRQERLSAPPPQARAALPPRTPHPEGDISGTAPSHPRQPASGMRTAPRPMPHQPSHPAAGVSDQGRPHGEMPAPFTNLHDDAANETDPDGQGDVLALFLDQLGLSRADYDVLTSGELDQEITDAGYAITDASGSDRILEDRLTKLDAWSKDIIRAVSRQHPGTEHIAENLIHNLPSILLFGSQGYAYVIDVLIAQMEGPGGEGELTLSDDLRYKHLKRHQGAIRQLWTADRRSPANWRHLTREIQSLSHALAQLKAAEGAKDRGRPTGVTYMGEPGHG